MDNKKNMDVQKASEQNVKEFISKLEEIIQCPICYETNDEFVQCIVGHHICSSCKMLTHNDVCPVCKQPFSDKKNFCIKSLITTFNDFKLSPNFSTLDDEMYLGHQLKYVFKKLSLLLNKSSDILNCFSGYLKDPNSLTHYELQQKLLSLTSEFETMGSLIGSTKETLIQFNKNVHT